MNLSLKGNKVYKGEETHNGILLKVHENSFTTGYSDLLTPNGKDKAEVLFGNGVYYDLARQDNVIFAGVPTYQGAFPYFAGILCRQQDVASGYPVQSNKTTSYNKGLLVKEGFIEFRRVYFVPSTGYGNTSVAFIHNSYVGHYVAVHKKTGAIGASISHNSTTDWEVIGRFVQVNPENNSLIAHISPLYTAGISEETAAKPTFSAPTSTKNTITVKAEATRFFVLAYLCKKSVGGTNSESEFTGVKAVFESSQNKFIATAVIKNLEANTEYKIAVRGKGVNASSEAELTKSTTNI